MLLSFPHMLEVGIDWMNMMMMTGGMGDQEEDEGLEGHMGRAVELE